MAEVKETVIIDAKVEGEKDVENLGKAIKDNKNQTEKLEKSTSELNKETKKTTREGSKGFGKLQGAVKGVGKGFNVLGAAMKAVGIGLVVALVAKLSQAFSQNQAIMDGVNRIFTTINIVFQELTTAVTNAFKTTSRATGGFDALGKVVSGLITLALTPLKISFNTIKLGIQQAQLAWEQSVFGDDDPQTVKRLKKEIDETKQTMVDVGVEAVNAGKDIVNNFGEAFDEVSDFTGEVINNVKEVSVSAAIASADALVQLRNDARLAEVQIQGVIEQYNRQAESLRQIRDDVRLTIDERIKANDDLNEVLEKQLQQQLKLANVRVDAARAEIKATGDNIDNQIALQQALNEVAATEAQITGFRSEQRVNEAALQDERRANLEELKQIGLEEAELRRQELESEFEQRKLLIERTVSDEQKKNEFLLKARQDLKNGILAIEEEEAQKQKELENKKEQVRDKELQAQKNRAKEQEQLITEGVGALAEGVGLGKEFAIAKTLFDTFQSARAAFSSQLVPGDPTSLPRAIGAAAFSAVSGLADVAAIKAVKTPNVAGAGGGASGQSASAPPPPSFNLVGQANTSAITQPITEGEDNPVQAFVVSKNVTTAQQADRNAEQQSTF